MKTRTVGSVISIGGTEIPVLDWECTLSANGQLAIVSARSSINLLSLSGIDIFGISENAANGATFDVYIGYDGSFSHVFGGVLEECRWDLAHDLVTLHALDWGAVLTDTNASIASLKSYRNQTVGQIVTQIAQANGFTPKVTDPGIMAGPLMNGENSYNPHPQPYWSLISNLAEQVGYDYYVTPDKTLFFGPEQTQGSINVNWGAPAARDTTPENPMKEFQVLYQPRDNSNFVVKVISHDPVKAQHVSASVDSGAMVIRRSKKAKNPTQIIGQSNGSKSSLGKSGNVASKKPTFLYRMDGLTPEACELKAQGIAKDIAKRLIILEGCIEGQPALKIHSEINIIQGQLDCAGFDGYTYSASEVKHTYSMPQGIGSSGGGFLTHFKAMVQVDKFDAPLQALPQTFLPNNVA